MKEGKNVFQLLSWSTNQRKNDNNNGNFTRIFSAQFFDYRAMHLP